MLLGSLGALAVVLSMAGLYGVLSHVTARRTREIGLRMALGAGRGDILRLVESTAAVTSVLACLPLVLAALVACYLHARRAARIEPNQALRTSSWREPD